MSNPWPMSAVAGVEEPASRGFVLDALGGNACTEFVPQVDRGADYRAIGTRRQQRVHEEGSILSSSGASRRRFTAKSGPAEVVDRDPDPVPGEAAEGFGDAFGFAHHFRFR